MAHRTTWEKDGCIIRIFGTFSADELEGINEEFTNHKNFDEVHYFIRDLTEIQEIKLSLDDIQVMAYKDAASSLSSKKIRGAFIVNNEMTAQISSYYIEQSLEAGSRWIQSIFYDFETAEKWVKNIT